MENAVEDFIGRDRERDEQADGRAFVAGGGGGEIQFGDYVVDRLLGQFGQVPLGEVVRYVFTGVHEAKVAMYAPTGIGCFPIGEELAATVISARS